MVIYYSPSIDVWLYPWTRRSPRNIKAQGLRDYFSIRYRIASYYNTLPDYIFKKYWIPFSVSESAIYTLLISQIILMYAGIPPPPAISLIILLLAIPASIVIYIAVDKALMRDYEKYVKWISK